MEESELIKSILTIHGNGHDIELDPCYSTGEFYKNGIIKEPVYKFDINPQSTDVKQCAVEHIPLQSESLNVIMYDSTLWSDSMNTFDKTHDIDIIKSLHQVYINALTEFYRLLKHKGIIIFKCQDNIGKGKNYFSHCFIYNVAQKLGLYPKDIFVYINTQNNNKNISYFWVLEKSNTKTALSDIEAILSKNNMSDRKKYGKYPQIKMEL